MKERFEPAEPAAGGVASRPPRFQPSDGGNVPGPPPPGSDGSGLAAASIGAGIANFVVLFGFGAVAALVLGYMAKARIDRSGAMEARRKAIAGIVLGWVGVVFDIGLLLLLAK